MLEKLLNKNLIDGLVSRTLEHSTRKDGILRICRQYLISLITMEFKTLELERYQVKTTRPSEAYPFITSTFTRIDKEV